MGEAPFPHPPTEKTNAMLRLALLSLAFVATYVANAALYVVSVGINDYRYINDQHLCKNDARIISDLFLNHTSNVALLTDGDATKVNILHNLRTQFGRARKGDTVIFYFSGHGYDNGFCPYDMRNFNSAGLSYAEIAEVMRSCNASKKIIMADACLSGGMRQSGRTQSRPATGNNVMLFLSSRSNENSIETPFMKNGFFTTYLNRGLRGAADTNRDRDITALELFNYVSSNVRKISNDEQHPVMWGKFDDNMSIIHW